MGSATGISKAVVFTASIFVTLVLPARADKNEIVGGQPVPFGQYPAYAASNPFDCGATKIHEDILMTAAHCDGGFVRSKFGGVYIGGTKNFGADDGEPARVIETMKHPDYDSLYADNDIMLVLVDYESPTHGVIQTLNTDPTLPKLNDPVFIIGHGYTTNPFDDFYYNDYYNDNYYNDNYYYDNDYFPSNSPTVTATPTSPTPRPTFYPTETRADVSPELLQVTVNVVKCSDYNEPSSIMICTTSYEEKGPCYGDSGGPLYTVTGKQLGIVSHGERPGCARPGEGQMFTRVSTYTKWIKEGICKMSKNPPSSCKPCGLEKCRPWQLLCLALNRCK